jgi:membrane fusion protein, copper/silver efflux system
MSDNHAPRWHEPTGFEPSLQDEGGLRAPPHLKGWRKAWWWFDFIILVKLARLRFIAVLVVIGAVITQWDLLAAYYDKWTRPTNAAAAGGSDVEWFCPMHPSVIRDNPREKCPICFMPLSKRKKGDVHDEVLPAGVVNRVQLSPYRVVLAGVATWKLDYVPLVKDIAAVGFIEFDERGQRTVSARAKGRIDELFVNQTGQMVDEGDVLASLYSPELNVTVQNLVDAQRNKNPELLRSARNRLQLLGISDDQIDEILATGKANTHLKIRSPISGHVIKKYVREGQYVDEGMPLYDIVDLSTVWIQAQVYEDDMGFLPLNQAHKPSDDLFTEDVPTDDVAREITVTATTRAFPNEPFQGKLAFIYPHVDEATRTVTVRCELPNPDHKLRPGTTATVNIHVPAQSLQRLKTSTAGDARQREMLAKGLVLALPETSVIDTGSQTIVYRQTSPGVFEGVKVELGPKMSGTDDVTFYPLVKGLQPGDEVVTTGSFLVDAETRLNPAAGSIYFGGSGGSKSGPSSVTTVRPSTPDDADAKVEAVLARLSDEDRKIVLAQKFCPILKDSRLGAMGPPVKLTIDGQTVFVCCDACKDGAVGNPADTLAKVAKLKGQTPPPTPAATTDIKIMPAAPASSDKEAKIRATLAKLSESDRGLAEAQKFCPVLETSRLGSMGTTIKVVVEGQPVFICCEACREDAVAGGKETLAKVEKLKAAGKSAK